MKTSWRHVTHFVLAWTCFLLIFFTTVRFVLFVSSQAGHPKKRWPSDVDDSDTTLYRLMVNALLLTMFVIQHSCMSSSSFKGLFGDPSIDRSLYVAATAIALQVLMHFWFAIPEMTFWRMHTENSTFWWWVFFIVHFVSWTIIYGTSIMMDLSELVGLKQAYYGSRGLADPLAYKSPEHRRLLEHMRHPSFSCICVLLYFRPAMTLDRLCLAIFFTGYMVLRFRVDPIDYAYLKRQAASKRSGLTR